MWPWNIIVQGELFDSKQCPRSSFEEICVRVRLRASMSNGHPLVHRPLFTRCDSVGCIYNCFEYWQRDMGIANRRAFSVAHVNHLKPRLQHPCSGETILRPSRVAVRRNRRAGSVTAPPSEQIVQFPLQAPFFDISSSSKLSLSNNVTFPDQEACHLCEIALLNWGKKTGKARLQVTGFVAPTSFQVKVSQRGVERKPWQLLPCERGDQTSILCVREREKWGRSWKGEEQMVGPRQSVALLNVHLHLGLGDGITFGEC